MATKEPTQKAKLALKAIPYNITTDVDNDYYISPKMQKNLTIDDLAAENSSAPCNYKYQKGTNYPELVNESINDGDLGGLGSTAHW